MRRRLRRRSLPLALAGALLVVALAGAACTSEEDLEGLPTAVDTDGTTTTVALPPDQSPCDGDPGVGGRPPEGSSPGDLVAATDLGPRHGRSEGYPTNARTWRLLYVSTGADETDLQLVCGMAAAPDTGPTTTDGAGRMLAWAHGTFGLQQACQPSIDPDTGLWGEMPAGIGAPAWGIAFTARGARPEQGALQTALDRGWVVSATDYQPNDTYIMGRVAAANVIDAARATSQLMAQEFGAAAAPDRYDTLTWGHSQGGHAALWAGQLMDTYQQGAPSPSSARLDLVGVAAEAPATNLLAQPERQPGVGFGDGLADWEMHKGIEIFGIPIAALELQIGPALFSYIFGSWTQFSARNEIDADAALPAAPPTGALDLDTVATDQGQVTIARMSALCLSLDDALTVKELVAPYRDAASDRLLTSSLWNLPDDYRPGQFFRGGVDRTCATTADASMGDWCAWIRFNIPGPLGEHPFPKVPEHDGEPVPVLIAQGADDEVIHCRPPEDHDESRVPPASDCMSTAYFESMRDAAYCPDGEERGHLQLSVFRRTGAGSPATHLAIPGQVAAVGDTRVPEDLRFTGSRLDRFMTGAFDATLEPGCVAEVVNAG